MFKRFAIGGAVLAAAALALLGIQLASAHSRPIRFDPPPGTVLSAAPAQVTGFFNAVIRRDPNWSFIHVTDATGARVDTGDATLSTDRLQMSVGLKSGLGPGRYLVTWRTYDDADGAVFGQCFTFFVGQAAADDAIATKYRLDGGRDCQAIDVSAKDGTPVAGGTPQATTAASGGTADDDDDEGGAAASSTTSDDGDSGDVPWWSLVIVGAVGLVAGGIGARVVGTRAS